MPTPVTAIVLAAATLAPLDDPKDRKDPPSKEALAAITARGKALAEYDAACWHASDALQAKAPKRELAGRYIARKGDKGWTVAFGRLDDREEKFLVAYEARQGARPDKFEVEAFDPPKAETGFFPSAARATALTLADFAEDEDREDRPYNVAVLPAEKGQLWVYYIPAPTRAGVWPLGGDLRYLVSGDGKTIVEERRMHRAVIEREPPEPGGDNVSVASFHNHVLDDIPEDSDVFHVLWRKPAIPEVVASDLFVFQVGVDGSIKYMGKTDEVLGK